LGAMRKEAESLEPFLSFKKGGRGHFLIAGNLDGGRKRPTETPPILVYKKNGAHTRAPLRRRQLGPFTLERRGGPHELFPGGENPFFVSSCREKTS